MRFVPDRIFDTVSEITPEYIKSQGLKGLVLDIDNTLAPRDVPLPDEALLKWIKALSEAGIKLYVISNNHRNRVEKFARALNLPFICHGMKPFPRAFARAAGAMGLKSDECAAVGDQIYTDVFGAHTAGMRAWLVSPIDPKETITFRLRRRLERPFINRYHRDNSNGGGKGEQ